MTWALPDDFFSNPPTCERCGVRYKVGMQPGADWSVSHSCILDKKLTAGEMVRLMELKAAGKPLDPWEIQKDSWGSRWHDASAPSV